MKIENNYKTISFEKINSVFVTKCIHKKRKIMVGSIKCCKCNDHINIDHSEKKVTCKKA